MHFKMILTCGMSIMYFMKEDNVESDFVFYKKKQLLKFVLLCQG